MNTSIFAADKSVDIGCRVIKWDEPGGLNLTKDTDKYSNRNDSYDVLKTKLCQFTSHWSATYNAKSTFTGIKARGLSCNFIIDDDDVNGYASVFQVLDIQKAGWSQGGKLNGLGAGVEISYMPDCFDHPDRYSAANIAKYKVQPHDSVVAPIHGTKLKVFLPTQAQINSLIQLQFGYCSLFPLTVPEYPRKDGQILTTKLADPMSYKGLVSHFHLDRNKIDAAGLDFENIEKEVKLRLKLGY